MSTLRINRTVGASAGPRLAALVGRHPLQTFLVWFFTVGQAIAFVPVVARVGYGMELPAEPFLITATLIGLLLPTVVITWITDGTEGLRALRRRTVAFKVHVRWYLMAIVAVPMIMFGATAALFGAPEPTSGPALVSALTSGFLLQLIVVFVTINWWEEVAWMGFVQARLQHRLGPILAAVITGALFALGHISLFIEDSVPAALLLMALLVAVCIPFRALQGWVYNRTGSLAIAGLVHASANATAAGSILGAGLLDHLYPEAGAGGLVFPVLGVLGLVVVAITRGRLGLTAKRPDPGSQLVQAPPATTG